MTQRPGAVDEANVSRETGSEDAVGQRDQPAAPFVTPVLVATAEPSVEGEPGKQAAGYSQGQGEQHPAESGSAAATAAGPRSVPGKRKRRRRPRGARWRGGGTAAGPGEGALCSPPDPQPH